MGRLRTYLRRLRVRLSSPVRHRRRRRGRRALALAAVLGLGLLVDGAWVATTLSREAQRLRTDLTEGARLLEQGRVTQAAARFTLAERSAASLRGALRHPAAVLAGFAPGLADDLGAARALAASAEEVARSGSSLVAAAATLGWDGTSVPGLVEPARVDVEAIARAAPQVEGAALAARRARDELERIPLAGLTGSLRGAVVDARAELQERVPLLERAALAAHLLPSFLGIDGPRRYLLIAQNLSDPRGSGGHIGSHAVLSVTDGRLELGPMQATAELRPGPPAQAPRDVVARYRRFGSLDHPMAVTYPPDFPTAARLLVDQWRLRGEPPVDGVISTDAVWTAALLEAIGPVQTPAWPEPLTAANAVEVLSRDTFATGDGEASNRLQAALAGAVWEAVLTRSPSLEGLTGALARSAAERHLQIYSIHPEEQEALVRLGVAGEVPRTDHPLEVTWFGASESRAGYFAETEVELRATLAPDGWAEVTLVATLRNGAPTGPPSILLGAGNPDEPVGSYFSFVNAYLPPDARVLDIRGGSLALEEREGGLPVVMGLLGGPSGTSERLTVRYRTEALVQPDGAGARFALLAIPQPQLRPALVRVRAELPAGASVLSTCPGGRVEAGSFVWEGRPTTPVELWIGYRLP